MDRQIIGVLKPTLQSEFGWSESDFADLIFWFQAAYALGYLGFGRLIDKIGARLGYAAVVIPGVNEAIDKKDLTLTTQQLQILTGALNRAAEVNAGFSGVGSEFADDLKKSPL